MTKRLFQHLMFFLVFAIKLTFATEKPLIMYYFYAPNCSACSQMKQTLADPKINEVFKNTEIIYINIHSNEGKTLALKYGIFGVPAFVLLDKKTTKVIFQGYGYLPFEKFVNLVQNTCKRKNIQC